MHIRHLSASRYPGTCLTGHAAPTDRRSPDPARAKRLNPFSYRLPTWLRDSLAARLSMARQQQWGRRLWAGDASLWTASDEGQWMGWLRPAAKPRQTARLARACMRLIEKGMTDAVILGMGGASLGSEVLGATQTARPSGMRLHVLDTTDPDQIRRLESQLDLERCLFVVASKSGSTLESSMLATYFFSRLSERLGREAAGERFIAITDPQSALHQTALRDGYAGVFRGDPTIGGRYSVLSCFGLVSLALQGHAPASFLRETAPMVGACSARTDVAFNPGLVLGAILGEAARAGRDKVTLLTCPRLKSFGGWLEQLLAESTGKNGRGIVPVNDEPLGRPESYGADRLFVYIRQTGMPCPDLDRHEEALAALGHPIVRMDVKSAKTLGQEFFRWEVATAVASAVLHVNPFDQPDVEASKCRARALVEQRSRAGGYSPPQPAAQAGALTFYGHQDADVSTPSERLAAHFARLRPDSYAAILAYLPNAPQYAAHLARWRRQVRDACRVATVGGFGPRYLHSCGQLHKGGPDGGVFLFITADHDDLPVPRFPLGFGAVQEAQAVADMEELTARGKACLRVHLGRDHESALKQLDRLMAQALRAVGRDTRPARRAPKSGEGRTRPIKAALRANPVSQERVADGPEGVPARQAQEATSITY